MLTSGRILAHLSNFITNINSTRECCSSFQIWSPVFFFFFIWNNSSILSCPSLKRVIHQPFFFSLWNLEQAFLLFALGNAVKMKSVFSNFLSSQFLSLYLPEFSYPPNPKNVWSHSENSNENETLSSGTSPLGYYCEVPPPPGVNTMVEWRGAGSGLALGVASFQLSKIAAVKKSVNHVRTESTTLSPHPSVEWLESMKQPFQQI